MEKKYPKNGILLFRGNNVMQEKAWYFRGLKKKSKSVTATFLEVSPRQGPRQ